MKKKIDLGELQQKSDLQKEVLMKQKEHLNKQEKDMTLKKDEEEKIQIEINQTNTELGSLRQSLELIGDDGPSLYDQNLSSFKDPKVLQKDLDLKETQLETIRSKLESSKQSLREKKQHVDELITQLKLSTTKNGQTQTRKELEESREFTKSEIQKLELQNHELEEESSDLQKELENKKIELKHAENFSNSLHKDLGSIMRQYQEKRQKKEALETKLVTHKIENVEARRRFNLDSENFSKMEKDFMSQVQVVNYGNYVKLKQEVLKQKVSGFHGILLDLVEFPDHIRLGLNQVGLGNLFTIIVDTYEAADKIIQINKDLKLGKINIYPLEGLDDQGAGNFEEEGLFFEGEASNKYPQDEDIAIFEHEITHKVGYSKISSQLKKVIKDLFQGLIMVKDLDTAISYAKEYYLDCVTAEGEVYRRGGITCDIGYTFLKTDVISSYIQLQAAEDEFKISKGLIDGCEGTQRTIADQLTAFTNESIELQYKKDLKTIEYKKSISEVSSIKHALMQDAKQLYMNQQNLEENRSQIVSLQKNLKVLERGPQGSNSEEQIKKLRNDLDDSQGKLLTQMELVTDQEKKQLNLQIEIDNLRTQIKQSKIAQCEQEMANFEEQNFGRRQGETKVLKLNLESSIENLQRKLAEKSTKLKVLGQELLEIEYRVEKTKKQVNEVQKELNELNQKKLDASSTIDMYNIKISSLKIDESIVKTYERKSDTGLIGDLNTLIKSTKYKYTEKDKLNFETLEYNFSEYKKFDEEIGHLKRSKIKFQKLIEHSSEHVEDIQSRSVIKFKEKFKEIFETIVADGSASIRLIENAAYTQLGSYNAGAHPKTSEGYYKGLEITTNFAQTQAGAISATQIDNQSRMENLSPGQKTIVAICIMLAFQSISPSPFYFLDEIEADLDTNYVEKISSFIEKMSKKSQIFMTTFKPQMATAKEASYYFVSVPEREEVSRVARIDQKTALNFLSSEK